MKTIIREENLHPNHNSGEAVVAIVSLQNRMLSVKFDAMCYGNHCTSMQILFHNPDDMIRFANTLIDVAEESKKYFRRD